MTRTSHDARPIREPVPLPEPGSDVGFALRNLMQTLRQRVETTLREQEIYLSFAQFAVLKELAKEPGLSGAQLARRTIVTAQSMNGLLHGLESTGMVVREPHPESRRTDCWFMTRAGYKQMQQVADALDAIVTRMLASLSKSDAARLSELLQECAAALQSGAATVNGSSRTAGS
jgi:DNA-binding MarR family transcriptional regulator